MILNLTTENFQEEIKEGKVLVDFFATWCGPCKMMHPVIDQVVESHPDLKVIKVDVDAQEQLASEYRIMSVPTFLYFVDGEIKQQASGFMPKEKIESWL